MENVASYVPITFGIAVFIGFVFWFISTGKDKLFLLLWLVLGIISSYLAYQGWFQDVAAVPNRLFFFIAPSILLPVVYLFTQRGKDFVHTIDDGYLHYMHGLRILVEFVLLWLHKAQYLPADLTFEGRNYDIVIGMTAPLVAHMGYTQKILTRNIIIGWNIIGILSLLNVVIHAVLSLPGAMNVINANMPNTAVLAFPYQLLPVVVVPMVFIAHIVVILRLIRKEVEVETPDE